MSWILFAVLSAFFAALVAIFGKIGIANVDSTLATTVRAIVMALVLVLISFALGKFNFFNSIHGKAWVFIVLSGLAGAISWLFYFVALKHGPAPGVAALDRLSVVFVLILAILFLGQSMTWKSGLGAALLTAGAILMTLK
ncbi:EamA family transporter [Candidatus Parcubacteria bacterium]|jgi:transporter family protein|nr:MAG: EamA family transporter [Candidatus Parcubacteria bacterium]